MTEQEILDTLDNSNDGYYCSFVDLGHVYSYLIDSRINVYSDANGKWVIAVERLGYNPRAGSIQLEIFYYGNCLINLEHYNNRPVNYYSVNPIDYDSFQESIDDNESIKTNASWLLRGQAIQLSTNKQDYSSNGIELKEYEPNSINPEEVTRLLITKHRELFRATDNELYKSIPTDLKKILVLDEWHHKYFVLSIHPSLSDEHLLQTYELNKSLQKAGYESFESFAKNFRHSEMLSDEWNKELWETARPSTYETWQQIAKVIVTNNANYYKPTLQANNNWTNWLDSGTM
jgi:hypothetical protein